MSNWKDLLKKDLKEESKLDWLGRTHEERKKAWAESRAKQQKLKEEKEKKDKRERDLSMANEAEEEIRRRGYD